MSNLENLAASFKKLPGIGPKTAQRLCYYILERNHDVGMNLSKALKDAIESIVHCERCQTLSDLSVCAICSNPKRDSKILCVVETPIDILAIEQTNSFNGLYFVLGGHLSPLDGIGPQKLHMKQLDIRLNDENIKEVIIATNPTIEGEATAHYITHILPKRNIKYTRIAHGVPIGGELEYIDGNTLSKAFTGRITLAQD